MSNTCYIRCAKTCINNGENFTINRYTDLATSPNNYMNTFCVNTVINYRCSKP